MRRILIRSAILIVVLAAASLLWIFAGRSLSLVLDRIGTAKMESRSVDHFVYDGNEAGGILEIVGFPLSTRGRDYDSFPWNLRPDAHRDLVLSLSGKTFLLGPLSPDEGKFQVAPQVGDKISLTTRRSFLSWPTPFNVNFMTGNSPSWKRNLYYVLDWRRGSGQRLEMVWHYEQYFYPNDGWANGFMSREGATGLIRVKILP